jgi:hypothetical protein
VLAWLCSRVADWAVMTDELLYERLAISVSRGGVPRLHGELVDVLTLLYPLLIAPVFAVVDLPTAIRVVHGVNGVLFASAAVPAYLLARELRLPLFPSLAAAVFPVAIPWTVIGGFVMTEAAAYPASLWAALAIQRAVVLPSPRRDGVAILAIGIAALARPQLVVLGLVLVVAAVVQELRFGRWREHVVAFAVAAAGLVVLALGGAGLLGAYSPALEEGRLLSVDALRSAVIHLDVTAVALGIVPLLLGLGWGIAALVRTPAEDARTAYAAVVVAATAILALQSGSVVVRFGLGLDVKDRYFFYVAPLLFLATACALDDPRPRIAGLLGVTAFFVLTVGLHDFEPVFGINVDSPASSTHEALTKWGNDTGIRPADALAIAGGLLAVVLLFALRRLPRAPLSVAVLVATLVFVAAETAYTWDRLLSSSGPSARAITAAARAELAWVDAAKPRGEVGMLAYFVGQDWFPNALLWWDLEYWNASVARAYLTGPYFTYTPGTFPQPRLTIDPRTGAIAGAGPVDAFVRTTHDARFRPAGATVAAAADLELVELDRPHRAAWVTFGLDPDGWTRPERRVALRVFLPPGATAVSLWVSAPPLEAPRRVTVGDETFELGSSEERQVVLEVCVPAAASTDVPIAADGSTSIRAIPHAPPYSERFREVGVRISRIEAAATGLPCPT